jgi:competence protein ComEC
MKKYIISILIIMLLFSSCKVNDSLNTNSIDNKLYMTIVNVGYGDCIILQYNGINCMIDTGHQKNIASLVGTLNLLNIKNIDALFLTHTHKDHIGGVPTLSKHFEIKNTYSATISETSKDGDNEINKLVRKYNLKHSLLNAGNIVNVGDLSFKVLGPLTLNKKDDNDNSLIISLSINDKKILFTGDMQFDEEFDLIENNIDLKSDILKVGNHGNPDATSKQFASLVDPSIALISTDREEDTDSANKRVISALDCDTYITDEFHNGILLTIDENGIINVEDLVSNKAKCNIELIDVDKKDDIFTIKNYGSKCDISGYIFVSKNNNYIFPENTIIKKNEQLTIKCKTKSYGTLYDLYGNKISEIK